MGSLTAQILKATTFGGGFSLKDTAN